jgi:hypothetical protein
MFNITKLLLLAGLALAQIDLDSHFTQYSIIENNAEHLKKRSFGTHHEITVMYSDVYVCVASNPSGP